jgi:protein ImuB
MESINLGWGVERLRLTASGLGRLAHEEGAWSWSGFGADRKRLDRAFGELLDTLSNRLGPGRVVRVDPAESHLPERTFRLRPVMEEEGKEAKEPGSLPGDRPSLLLEAPEPIAVIAMMPDGPPSWFRWRGTDRRITASAGPERIAAEWWTGGAGVARPPARRRKPLGEPYARAYERFMLGRAAPAEHTGSRPNEPLREADDDEPAGETRDYFKVQDEHGRWLWIYRVLEQGCWFVHGLWA